MLLRREQSHRRRRAVYLFSGIVVVVVLGVWLAQMGILFRTASSEEFQTNFLKLQNDIDEGMLYGNSQIGSQYPDMTKSPDQMIEEVSDATAETIQTQQMLNAAAEKIVERLNANASAQEEMPAPEEGATSPSAGTTDAPEAVEEPTTQTPVQ